MDKIIVTHVYPPIPYRNRDWLAYIDGEEEGLQGWGKTKEDAVEELKIAQEEVTQ